MKNSNIEWIGDIPTSWQVWPLKRVCTIKTGSTPPKDFNNNYFNQDGILWIKPSNLDSYNNIEKTEECISDEGVPFATLFKENTVFICCIASIGKVGFCKEIASCNQQINGLSCKSNYNWKFLYYVSIAMNDEYQQIANKSVVPIINTQKQGTLYLPVPAIDEQEKIAFFLDSKVSSLNEMLNLLHDEIETLKNHKKALIFETVTKGLSPKSKMKQTGIEWIGEIPANWSVMRLSVVADLYGRIGWQGLTADEYIDEGPFLITGTDFCDGNINWETCVHISNNRWAEAVQIRVNNGDLLITKDGTVGKLAIVSGLKGRASLNSGLMRIVQKEQNIVDTKFLYYVLKSDVFKSWYYNINSGSSTIQHLFQGDFNHFTFPFPQYDEQKLIVEYLDGKIENIEKCIKIKTQQFELLIKKRQSLIFEYITGKQRVKD